MRNNNRSSYHDGSCEESHIDKDPKKLQRPLWHWSPI